MKKEKPHCSLSNVVPVGHARCSWGEQRCRSAFRAGDAALFCTDDAIAGEYESGLDANPALRFACTSYTSATRQPFTEWEPNFSSNPHKPNHLKYQSGT